MAAPPPKFDPTKVERPDPKLWKYYLLQSIVAGPFFPLVALPMWFKYETMRYRFDDDGVSMSWGILFRKEVHLTYRRIQDIHLTRNVVERWLGLAAVAVQTASGSATPEMTIEGVLDADGLRDFLYSKMRGARGEQPAGNAGEDAVPVEAVGLEGAAAGTATEDEALDLLREIRDLLKQRAGTQAEQETGREVGEGGPR